MATIRSFAAPHKGLRNVISQFAFRLGQTDISDPSALQQLKQLGNEMFALLNDHVHTENEHTLRHLEERAPGASVHDREDHEKLAQIQDDLKHQLQTLTGQETHQQMHDFYLRFTLFQSQFLERTHAAETVTEALLQQHFPYAELIRHRQTLLTRLSPDILLLGLKYIVPAQRGEESLGMLSGLKANVPK